jgi:hypothetical protein
MIRTRCPQVILYLFEKKADVDEYNAIIRNGIKYGKPEWVSEEGFVGVVAKLQEGTTFDEYEFNAELTSKGTRLPRQLFFQVLVDPLQWTHTMLDDQNYGQKIADKLNKDNTEILTTYGKPQLKKTYLFDQNQSWATPEERLPLGMYIHHGTMFQNIMTLLFEPYTLAERSNRKESWAVRYPQLISHFFVRGGSDTAKKLGVLDDYYWEDDPVVIEERRLQQQRKREMESADINDSVHNSSEEDFDISTPEAQKERDVEVKHGKASFSSTVKRGPILLQDTPKRKRSEIPIQITPDRSNITLEKMVVPKIHRKKKLKLHHPKSFSETPEN